MTQGRKEGDKSELLTKEEMDRLINVVSGDLFFTTLYKVLKYSGRRIGEIYGTVRNKKLTGGVKFKDVDLSNGTMKTIILKTKKRKLTIVCKECNKNNTYKNKCCSNCGKQLPILDESQIKYDIPQEIILSLRKEAIEILRVYIEQHKPKFKDNDYIFRKYSLIYLKKQIKKHCRQASITKNFSLHGFRTYFISNAIKNGITDSQIIKWTGHTNVASLSAYNQLVPKDVEAKINEMTL